MEKPNPLLKKLYVIKDIEGKKNTKTIETIRGLEVKLKQYPWFIGLGLMGSTVRGYSVQTSDIDGKIIYDSSKVTRSKVIEVVKLHTDEVEREYAIEHGLLRISRLAEFDLKKIEEDLRGIDANNYMRSVLVFRDLTGIVVGEKVEECRTSLRYLLSKLQPIEKQRVLDQIVDTCITEENLSKEKLVKRTGMGDKEENGLWRARRELWTKRVNKIWSLV